MSTAPDTASDPGRRRGGRLRLVAVALAVVVVASAGVLVAAIARGGGGGSVGDRVSSTFGGTSASDTAAQTEQSARDAVMAVADQFVLRFSTYGPSYLDNSGHMPKYADQVKAVMSAKFASSFDQSVSLAEKSVSQTGVARAGKVSATGVVSIDDDSADVMVAGVIATSYPDPQAPKNASKYIAQEPLNIRLDLSMVKVAGEWKVDDFTPVTGTDGSTTGATSPPTTAPTTTPTTAPTTTPTGKPTSKPTGKPTSKPTGNPTGATR